MGLLITSIVSVPQKLVRQTEAGKQGCSNGLSVYWLKLECPKHAICPHQEDYCNTCAAAKETIQGKQTTLNQLMKQAAASTPE